MSSTNDNNADANPVQVDEQQQKTQATPKRRNNETRYQSGMRPSIVTTINNTSPHNNNTNAATRNRQQRTNEPYESYIEDSFVGHWEHEDDEDEYHEDFDAESHDGCEEEKSELHHPSTIEFDFDSFGPESIIYSPPTTSSSSSSATTATIVSPPAKGLTTTAAQPGTTVAATTTAATASVTSRPPPLLEVSREAEKADELVQEDIRVDNISPAGHVSRTDDTPTPETNSSSAAATPPTPGDRILNPRALNIRPATQEYLVDPAQIDLKVIEPYKKVISHAGYCNHFDPSVPGEPTPPGVQPPAVIVFSACYLPDRSRRDYNYVMDHLFLYVLTSLHELIADDYILIYLHNTQPPNPSSMANGAGSSTSDEGQTPNNLPTFTWMKRCYQMIDRRLRKNLRILYLVKPTFWLKTIVIMCKPFISSKFSKKLRFVEDMNALRKCMPVDKLILPASADNL